MHINIHDVCDDLRSQSSRLPLKLSLQSFCNCCGNGLAVFYRVTTLRVTLTFQITLATLAGNVLCLAKDFSITHVTLTNIPRRRLQKPYVKLDGGIGRAENVEKCPITKFNQFFLGSRSTRVHFHLIWFIAVKTFAPTDSRETDRRTDRHIGFLNFVASANNIV